MELHFKLTWLDDKLRFFLYPLGLCQSIGKSQQILAGHESQSSL